MIRNSFPALLASLALFASVLPAPAQEQTVGLFVYDADKAFQGYTLVAPKHYTRTYLIDNNGYVLRTWDSSYEPGQSVYLLENGHVLHACMVKVQGGTGGGEGGRIEEYDWDGNLVWEFDYATRDYQLHHDIEPLPNGNVLALLVIRRSRNEAIAAGINPNLMRDEYILPDSVIEIEPTRSNSGRIVWEWHVWDHLIQDYDASKANYGFPAAHPELVDPNVSGHNIPAFWNHMNSIDYNPELDQVMLSVRGNSEFWVIDHGTTSAEAAGHTGGRYGKGGDLLYRWGNPQMYGAGNTGDQTLFQQHDAQWIEPGCPGEGNILIFNNGLQRPAGQYSSVDEIVPPVDANGSYPLAPGSAFGPAGLAWTYTTPNPHDMYAEAISGAQRLPNGNTLMCDGTSGIFREVTPGGETVWRYVNPVVKEGPLRQGQVPGLDQRGHNWNAVFKIHRYAPDYPGLADKDLTPRGPIEIYRMLNVNAASFLPGPLAPGAIVSGFGEELSAGEAAATSTPLPVELAGTSIEITDSGGTAHLCPLFYVSSGQINFYVPEECARGQAVLSVRNRGAASFFVDVRIDTVAPGLFAMNAGGEGVGAIVALRVAADNTQTEAPVFEYDATRQQYVAVPIDLGLEADQIILLLYGTGIRGAPDASAISVTIGGEPAPVLGAAAQVEYVGLDQVNVGPLPRSLAGRGEVQIVLEIDGARSNTVSVNIQ